MSPAPTRSIFASTGSISVIEPLRERLEVYLAAGIDRIELGANVTVEPEVAASVKGLDARFLIHNYFPPPAEPFVVNLASHDTDLRGRSVALARRALDLSATLGAPFYSVHSGFITDAEGFDGTGFTFPGPPRLNHALEQTRIDEVRDTPVTTVVQKPEADELAEFERLESEALSDLRLPWRFLRR